MEAKNQVLQFKTNINCGGCVAAVKPYLDKAAGERHWQVATEDPDKTLTVTDDKATREDIIAAVEKAGFKIEPVTG